jgi:hypothetical protein
MIELVLTVMISAFSLAEPGQAAITTNELPPPAGMSDAGAPAPSAKPGAASKTPRNAAPKPSPEKSVVAPEAPSKTAAEKVKDAGGGTVASPGPSGAETAQPTTEERQAPTSKQAGGSASPGRVAAFWFILPNRPPENK